MSRIDDLIAELCPDGVEYRNMWELTTWDKKFSGVAKYKQPTFIKYNYLLASDLKKICTKTGNVKLLNTGFSEFGVTTEDIAGGNLHEGEIIAIPWGSSSPWVQYYKGKFVTADNRIATSNNTDVLNNKYLYYWVNSNIKLLTSFYRGSGIQHPSMAKVLDMYLPLPPLLIQEEIVRILDNFTDLLADLTADLTAELTARKQQYEYYREALLAFDESVLMMKIGDICELSSGGDVPKGHWDKEQTEEYSVPIFSNSVDNDGLYGYTDIARITKPCVTITGRGAGVGHAILRKKPFFPIIRLVSAVPRETINVSFLYYCIQMIKFNIPKSGIPQLTVPMVAGYSIPVPSLEEQERIVAILDRFDTLINDITSCLPAEIKARKQQYEYYRDKLLTFKEECVS